MPAIRPSLRRVALTLVAGLVFCAAGVAAVPAAAAAPASSVSAVMVAPYEAANPLVPSAALPYLAVTVIVDRELPDAGDTFVVQAPAGTRVVLSAPSSMVDADGAALVDVAVTAQTDGGDTITGTFTPKAADSRRVSGTFTFFLQVVGSGILDAGGGTYRPVFLADGVRHTAVVPYGVAIDLFERVGGYWLSGATSSSSGRFVVQAKAVGDAALAAHGGQWIAAGAEPTPPFSGSAPDCGAVEVRAFAVDPGPVNIPISGGTDLAAGTDYILNCADSSDGVPVVSATIPDPVDGVFYVLSSARDVTGEITYFPTDGTDVPAAGRFVGLFSTVAATGDASRDPSRPTQTSTLLMYSGRSGGVGTAEEALPDLDLAAASSPAAGTMLRQGDRVGYRFTLTNTGNVPLASATLTADLMSLRRAARIDGPVEATRGAAILDGDALRWTDTLAPGESVTVSFTAVVTRGGAAIVVGVESSSPGARGGAVPVEQQTLASEVAAEPPANGAATAPRELARTGADSSGPALLGIVLALAGAALAVVGRTRRRTIR